MEIHEVIEWAIDGFRVSIEPIEDTVTITETEYGYEVKYLSRDDISENPLIDMDCMGLIIFHPHSKYKCNDGDFEDACKHEYAVPLDAYIHSGMMLSVAGEGHECMWDTSHTIAVWIPDEHLEVKTMDDANKYARNACELLNQWLNDDVYGCVSVVFDKDKKEIGTDSCWSFFGHEHALESLKEEY